MNFGKIYSDATKLPKKDTPEEEKEKLSAEQHKAIEQQSKEQWLKHPVTINLLKIIAEQQTQLLEQAVQLAVTYHQHNNHQQIIKCLIEADALTKYLTK